MVLQRPVRCHSLGQTDVLFTCPLAVEPDSLPGHPMRRSRSRRKHLNPRHWTEVVGAHLASRDGRLVDRILLPVQTVRASVLPEATVSKSGVFGTSSQSVVPDCLSPKDSRYLGAHSGGQEHATARVGRRIGLLLPPRESSDLRRSGFSGCSEPLLGFHTPSSFQFQSHRHRRHFHKRLLRDSH